MIPPTANMNIVLLHGFCMSSFIWDDMKSHFPSDINVIALDLSGFGDEAKNISNYTMADFAREVKQQLDQLQVNEYVIVGHSMGGYIALELCKIDERKVKGLCLFHSTAYDDSPERKAKRDQMTAFIRQNDIAIFAKNFIPGLFANPTTSAPAILKLINSTGKFSKETLIAAVNAMKNRFSTIPLLSSMEIPVLLIAGKMDDFVTLPSLEEQSQLSHQIDLKILLNSAHMGMLEEPYPSFEMLYIFVLKCFRKD